MDHVEDCKTAGQVLYAGTVVKRDVGNALGAEEHACDLGLMAGCNYLHQWISAGAEPVLTQECGQRRADSCLLLGSLYSAGKAVPAQPMLAVTFLTRACEIGAAAGCGRLGSMYILGQAQSGDPGKGRDYLEMACRSEHVQSCFVLAEIYGRGINTIMDKRRAKKLLSQACYLGSVAGCEISSLADYHRMSVRQIQ